MALYLVISHGFEANRSSPLMFQGVIRDEDMNPIKGFNILLIHLQLFLTHVPFSLVC